MLTATSLAVLVPSLFISPGAVAMSQETQRYVASSDPYVHALGGAQELPASTTCPEPSVGLGGACFTLPGGTVSVDIDINDNTGRPVPAYVDFRDADNALVGTSPLFCDAAVVQVPSPAISMVVLPSPHSVQAMTGVGGPVAFLYLPPADETCADGALPTAGTITAVYATATSTTNSRR